MKETIFVVDGNFYLHRAYAVTRAVHREFGVALNSMFIGMICKDMAAVRAKKILVAFDGCKVFRYDVYPYYKANRHESHEPVDNTIPGREGAKEIYTYLDGLKAILNEIKISVISHDQYEADDCCCSAAKQYGDLGYRVVIGTRDKDSFQYLREDVELYDSSFKVRGEPRPRYIKAEDVKELKGVEVKQMRTLQALTGDAIDNIPSIMSLRQAKRLILEYGTVKNAIKSNEEYKQLLVPRMEDLKRNVKLVTLVDSVDLPKAESLSVPRLVLDEELKRNLPKSYFNCIDYLNPRTGSLF